MKAKGWSVFWRESKRRWVLSRVVVGRWEQKILAAAPHENTKKAETEANRIAQTWMAEQGERPADALARAAAGMLVSVGCAKWLTIAEQKVRDGLIAPATVKDYRTDANKYLLPKWGETAIASLGVPGLRQWFRDIRGEKSASTIRGLRSSCARFYDCAVAEGWIPKQDNPFENSELLDEIPQLPAQEAPRALPIAWVHGLVSAVDVVPLMWRAKYTLAATSGARDGEIHGLRLCDLHRTDEIPWFRIDQANAIVGPEGFSSVKAPKTKTSRRSLPFHPTALAAVDAWLRDGWAMWVGRDPTSLDPLFPGERGDFTRPRSAEELRRDLAAVGLPTQIDGHDAEFKGLRATFATVLDEAGVSEQVRQRLMGHRARTVTERHYTRRELLQLSAAVSLIPLAWPGTESQVVAVVTDAEPECPVSSATPGRVELPTNGLGNLLPVTADVRASGQKLADGRPVPSPLIGCDIAGEHDPPCLGHKVTTARRELADDKIAFAIGDLVWGIDDALVANDLGIPLLRAGKGGA